MVIKLSSWLWIRNNTLEPLTGPESEAWCRGIYGFTDDDRKKVAELIKEVDGVSTFRNQKVGDPILGPNVMILGGYTEIVQDAKDVKRYGELLDSVYEVMKKHPLQADFYVKLGEAFAEGGARPKPEIRRAVNYATNLEKEWWRWKDVPNWRPSTDMCWETIMKYDERAGLEEPQ